MCTHTSQFQQRIPPQKDAFFHINSATDKAGFEVRDIDKVIGKELLHLLFYVKVYRLWAFVYY